jgi:hypothetical protein
MGEESNAIADIAVIARHHRHRGFGIGTGCAICILPLSASLRGEILEREFRSSPITAMSAIYMSSSR